MSTNGELFGPFDREGRNVLGKLYILVCQFNLLTFCSWNVSVEWVKLNKGTKCPSGIIVVF